MKESQARMPLHQPLTLAQLKQLQERSSNTRTGARKPPLLPRAAADLTPLSFAQERLWLLDQIGLVGSAYNMPAVLRLEGELNVSALARSLNELIRRHESLRTRIGSQAGTPVQIIDPPPDSALPLVDLSASSEMEKRARLQQYGSDMAERPFDLAREPLLRALLLKLAPQEHLLLLTVHHIVIDGWSWDILHRELRSSYAAHASGSASVSLPELPVQYADYAIWQRQWLRDEVLRQHLTYWTEQLRGAPPQLELPTDRPRPAVESFKGARLKFTLTDTLSRALKALAHQEGCTLFMIFLATYQLLLSRWSRQQDVVVGSPVAGREAEELDGLIGLFVNTVVLRTSLAGEPSFRELLGRVKEVTLGAYEHQALPFEMLVKELRPERTLARQPIFQAMLALQSVSEDSPTASGLNWHWSDVERTTTHFDLTLYVTDSPQGISGVFEYATDLFDAETIERWSQHLVSLLQVVVTAPERSIDRLPILGEAERHRLLTQWNATTRPYPAHLRVHEVFEAQVARAPEAIAAVFDDQTLTYAQLNAAANHLARHLRSQGVEIGERVPVVMSRSVRMLIAQLAVLKIGAAYVPVDAELPPERQAFLFNDCGARRVLSETRPPAFDAGVSLAWVDYAEAMQSMTQDTVTNLQLPMPPMLAAYVMYTSGSTGNPKGVVVQHAAVSRLVLDVSYVSIEPKDRIAHCSNPAFDASTFEIWGALLNGAAVVIVPESTVLEASAFAQLLTRHRVTVLWLTVGLFNQYVDALACVFGQLRYLMTGGDVVEPERIRRVLRHRPQHLLNAYGPTECVTFSTTYPIETLADDATSLPIGRPISNATIYILDAYLQPVPIGVPGEIYIGGQGVAQGYLDRPALTAERFIVDPFSARVGRRLYKSGDLGRWRGDGNIEFLGRNDQQVKIRGFRIELGEIEAQLARHPQVKASAVVVHGNPPHAKTLTAYVVASDASEAPTVASLRAHMKAALPQYMVPSAFVLLERLPLTANGKLDRRALPAPDMGAYAREQYEPPQGEVEALVAEIWQALLQVERVGRFDHFFELGGHSLLATQVVARIHSVLSVSLQTRSVFEHPTLEQLAAHVEERRDARLLEEISTDRNGMGALLEEVAAIPEEQLQDVLRDLRMRKER